MLFLFVFLFVLPISALQSKNNEGYFSNPVKTKYGIVVSNEYESAIYLINGSTLEELVNAPGCGRFLTINKEGNLIGFKLINPDNGLQCPAILDLNTREIRKLEDQTENAGQVSFADDGSIVYSVQNKLFIIKGNEKTSYDLGLFSNRTPVSPDGNKVLFKDDSDQLWLFDLQTKNKLKITDSKTGYGNAAWSPDGKNIVFTSVGTDIFVFNLLNHSTNSIGEGENPSWSKDGKFIVYHKKEIDFNKVALINSDIYISGFDGSFKRKLTDTPDEIELDAKFSETGEIVFHNYLKREILQKKISTNSLNKASAGNVIFKLASTLNLQFYNPGDKKSSIAKSNSVVDWVHIHQVWDTRSSGSWYQNGEGYVCCGATSAMEVLASYGILKPWPLTTYGHTSNYGLYISDSYSFNGYTYSGYDGWPSGAHGYMWNGSGSPYANTVGFLKRHGITNTKRDESVGWSNVLNEINAGYPYIVCSTGLTSGHIVVIIGQYGSGHTVVCNDPYGDKNAGSYGALRNGKNAIYDWSDANTGRVKVTPVVWAVTARFQPNIVPEILSYSPASVSDSVSGSEVISINFTQQMDSASTINAFKIEPAVDGKFVWQEYHQTLTFKSNTPFTKSTKYVITIDTTAKSVWATNLVNEFRMEFNVKSRENLFITKYYPEDNQEDISTTVQFSVMFDAEVANNAFVGNVLLFNQDGSRITLTGVKIKLIDDKTYLTFECKNPLDPQSKYTLLYCSKINDVENYFLKDTLKISFTTEDAINISGNLIDDFESIKEWRNPSYSESTTGVDTLASSFKVNNSRKYHGSYTGKLTYSFSNNEGGLCRIYNPAKPDLSSKLNSHLGLYVFGDNSKNILELWFDENGADKIVVIDTLNWTGWKFKSLDLSLLNFSGEVHLNSFAIRQTPDAGLSGEIYFDDLLTFITSDIADGLENQQPTEYALYQNFPNPFNPVTTINYSLPKDSRVNIAIYNSLGELVEQISDENKLKGIHQIRFDGSELSSGVYFYKMNASSEDGTGSYTFTKKLILLK
jgi:hypothetical protein